MEGFQDTPPQQTLIAHESVKREEQETILQSLEGYKCMSQKQQQFLRNMLYVQQRAERGTDEGSALRIAPANTMSWEKHGNLPYISHNSVPEDKYHIEWKKYKESQLAIMSEYCHKTVDRLESYAKEDAPQDYEWIWPGPISSLDDLTLLVELIAEKQPPPYVIEIWDGIPEAHGRGALCHTTALLGKKGDHFIVWEKSGFSLPFQITTLDHIYTLYKDYTGWRIRPLST